MDTPTTEPKSAPAGPPVSADDRYRQTNYLMKRQVMKLIGAAIRIYSANGQLLFYVEQKAFKLKEDIRVYADEAKTKQLLGVNARRVLDFHGTYDVTDIATGQKIGALQRKGFHSMVRDEWKILDMSDVEVGRIVEDNMALALVRRFLTALIPQSYDVEYKGAKVADYRQKFSFVGYQMHLDFTAAAVNFDKRLGIAAAVLLSLIEGKQAS